MIARPIAEVSCERSLPAAEPSAHLYTDCKRRCAGTNATFLFAKYVLLKLLCPTTLPYIGAVSAQAVSALQKLFCATVSISLKRLVVLLSVVSLKDTQLALAVPILASLAALVYVVML